MQQFKAYLDKQMIKIRRAINKVLFITVAICCPGAFAADPNLGNQDFGDILYNVTGSFTGIAKLVFGISIIAGLSFAIAAIFKFKQHKDNPAQVTIGQPIGLLFLGASMIWLPFIIKSMGSTVTGAKNDAELYKGQSVIEYNRNTEDKGLGQFLIPNR